jgi:2-octaprenyl-6-methoxyphenol hydroxylase
MYDLLIVGGGMVGGSLACALAGQALRVAVIEAVPPSAPGQPSYDARAVTLSLGSRRILEGIGTWDRLSGQAVPIHRIHVSDRGHFGCTRLSAREEAVPALGYVVEARMLGPVLEDGMRAAEAVELISPARLVRFTAGAQGVSAVVDRGGKRIELAARLLVAADGGRSLAREVAGIGAREWDYGQAAVTANVTPEQPHNNTAFERFTETGPMAMLPMSEGRCALVWTVRAAAVEELLGLDDAAFLKRLQERFGYRLGRFLRVGQRSAYPLSLIRAREQARERLVVIGNAAHSLHPIAGQGFNLGLRDVAVLAQVLVDALREGHDPGALAVLSRYADWRRQDQTSMTLFTDTLVRVFSNELTPLVWGRNLALLATDLLPPAKHILARFAMGLAGRQPRLARGLVL